MNADILSNMEATDNMSVSKNGVEFVGDISNPLAVILRSTFEMNSEGIEFFSKNDWNLQIGYISRRKGYVIPEHIHNPIERTIEGTQEVLLIRKGECVIELFDDHTFKSNKEIITINLKNGDIILLRRGGHKITITEDCEIFEMKQGPYFGVSDKKLTHEI